MVCGSGVCIKAAKVNRVFLLKLINLVKNPAATLSGFTKFRKPCQKGCPDLYTAVIFKPSGF